MNSNKQIQAVVLAGGKSSRFNTGRSKLLEKICGQEMILYPTALFQELEIPTTILVGFERKNIQSCIEKRFDAINFVEQVEQQGTGHAVACTKSQWYAENILVINGDNPLIKKETIETLVDRHIATNATISFITAHNADPTINGYGRVISENGYTKIVEAKEFHGDLHAHCCINAGVYIFKKEFLEENIQKLEQSSVSNEFYLTDLIELASEQGHHIELLKTSFDEIRGINNFRELWTAEQIKRSELISYWMERGVRFQAAQSTHIDVNVSIGAGTYIGSGVHVMQETVIGEDCNVECFSVLKNSKIGKNVTIYSHSIISDSTIENNCIIGPFAHIEAQCSIDEASEIGNFVQVKRSSIGKNTKAKHLSYLGDTIAGSNTNIGAGTITCNYDGVSKHPTIIQDHCFIGSNNTLIAPLIIGSYAFTAAGSTINKDVPTQALAIARARQILKENYAKKLKDKALERTEKGTAAIVDKQNNVNETEKTHFKPTN